MKKKQRAAQETRSQHRPNLRVSPHTYSAFFVCFVLNFIIRYTSA